MDTSFTSGLCCYLTRMVDHTPESIRGILRELELNGVWLSVRPAELRGEPWLAVSIQRLRDQDHRGGQPVSSDEVGQAMSAAHDAVLELVVGPGGSPAALGLFSEGERWREPLETPLPGMEDAALSRLVAGELVELAAVQSMAEPECGEHTEMIHPKGQLTVPPWVRRDIDLFRFTERNLPRVTTAEDAEGAEDEEEGPEPQGRLCLVAMDLTRLGQMVKGYSVARAVQVLTAYANPAARRFLGPMGGDLADVQRGLRHLPGSTPLREVPDLTDLAELLALINTRLSTPGHLVEYLDEVFFPLMNLSSGDLPPAMDPDDLDDLTTLDMFSAMADQLPYFAPEGELMESLADGEATPLCDALEIDDDEGGAIWLLDPARIRTCLEAFDPAAFSKRQEAFHQLWWEAERERWDDDQKAWMEHRLLWDAPAEAGFYNTWAELKSLMAIAEDNALQPAMLFYE